MTGLTELIRRNSKLFFKDKGTFFTSLITPVILLVLYATFLAGIYHDSFVSMIPEQLDIDASLIDAAVGGQLASSLLAVCCVTVAFCSNMLMVQDKVTGAIRDLTVSPVRRSTLALGYFAASALVTLIICFAATGICLLYILKMGWYLTAGDVLSIICDVFLLVLFGTALSSCVNYFLATQGQLSAVGTVVSSGYGFICGAYMPISNFPDWLQKALSFLPGTYGTSLLRNHWTGSAIEHMADAGLPAEAIEAIKSGIDCNISFGGSVVETGTMYLIIAGSTAVIIGIYILINILCKPRYGDR